LNLFLSSNSYSNHNYKPFSGVYIDLTKLHTLRKIKLEAKDLLTLKVVSWSPSMIRFADSFALKS
jgi:hypothetical protein